MLADQVLYSGVACIVDLIVKEGLINLDFADVKTVMSGMGTAMMGTGEASGERRAIEAAEEAISNPLLDDVSLRGAKGLLLSITGGRDLTLYEVDEARTACARRSIPTPTSLLARPSTTAWRRVRVSIVASGMARTNEQPAPAQTSSWPRTPPLEPAYQAAARAEPVAPPVNVTAPTVSAHEPSYSWAPAPSQPASLRLRSRQTIMTFSAGCPRQSNTPRAATRTGTAPAAAPNMNPTPAMPARSHAANCGGMACPRQCCD